MPTNYEAPNIIFEISSHLTSTAVSLLEAAYPDNIRQAKKVLEGYGVPCVIAYWGSGEGLWLEGENMGEYNVRCTEEERT